MTDEEYLFKQTELERKRIGRGDRNKKRQGGKTIRFPSDYLTRKQKMALNGEVKTFMKKDFYSWAEFISLPADMQVAWVNSIVNRYGVGMGTISTVVLGKSTSALKWHFGKAGDLQYINAAPKGKAVTKGAERLREDFAAWRAEEDAPQENEDLAPQEAVETAPQEEATEDVHSVEAKVDVSNLALLLSSLVGTGAEITIRLKL